MYQKNHQQFYQRNRFFCIFLQKLVIDRLSGLIIRFLQKLLLKLFQKFLREFLGETLHNIFGELLQDLRRIYLGITSGKPARVPANCSKKPNEVFPGIPNGVPSGIRLIAIQKCFQKFHEDNFSKICSKNSFGNYSRSSCQKSLRVSFKTSLRVLLQIFAKKFIQEIHSKFTLEFLQEFLRGIHQKFLLKFLLDFLLIFNSCSRSLIRIATQNSFRSVFKNFH